MPSDYYNIDTTDREAVHKAAKALQEKAWSNHCDLDYWIKDMCQRDGVPNKHVLKMAMKLLAKDFYDMSGFLSRIEEDKYECTDGR